MSLVAEWMHMSGRYDELRHIAYGWTNKEPLTYAVKCRVLID